MRVDLPSGVWVDVAEAYTGKTRKRVLHEMTRRGDGARLSRADAEAAAARMVDAFLVDGITGWSLAGQGVPVPSRNAGGAAVIRRHLDDGDYAALHSDERVKRLLVEVTGLNARDGAGRAVA
jgi:hypothetical protein